MEVYSYLSWVNRPPAEGFATAVLLEQEEKPEMPPYFELYLRLKRWNMPLLQSGGYCDQPYLDTIMIEACQRAESGFKPLVTPKQPSKPTYDE